MDDPKYTIDSPREEEKKRRSSIKAFALVCEIGFVVAVPILGFGFLGKWLDGRNGTRYWTLLGIVIALIISLVIIVRRVRDILKDIY